MADTGRPPIFETPEAMQAKVDEYFTWVQGEFKDHPADEDKGIPAHREWLRHPTNTTVTGLALFLGFESRQSIYDYETKGEFSYIIKKARMKVEEGYEQRLHGSTPTGAIFALKNMGWKDKTDIDLGGNGNPIKTETHIKIIRDTASSIAPGDFTPQSATGTESEEKV